LWSVNTTDFGWRLHGRTTTLLRDRSFDLTPPPVIGETPFVRHHRREVRGLESCLQCGACTATCDLAGDAGLFPRPQVTFVRLGLTERAAAGPEVWQCYGCTDCTARCPSGAKPAEIMAALRQLATERNAYPRRLARVSNDPRFFWVTYVFTAAFLAGLVAVSGHFRPGAGPIDYAGMLPNDVLIPVFCGLAALVLGAAGAGVARAWSNWRGLGPAPAPAPVRLRWLWHDVRAAVPEIVAQRKLSQCEEGRLRPWAHRAVVLAFVGLAALSGVISLSLLAGGSYPLPMASPGKVLGNVFAVLLIAGTSYFMVWRADRTRHGQPTGLFDWVFLSNLLLAGLTGVATELLRVADVRGAAYPVYFLHLVVVLVLMLTLPYGKLAHVLYRVTALVRRDYGADGHVPARRPAAARRRSGRSTMPAPVPPAAQARPSPEALLAMGHDALAGYPDGTIEQAYYQLRDEAEPRPGGRYYPNIKRLFGTAFEREKDRREIDALVRRADKPEWQSWYEEATEQPCTWWIEHHIGARHALTTCMNCGMCTSVCPAAEHFEEYDPRCIVDAALSGDEDRLVALLKSDVIWYCAQCGSCNSRCPHNNDIMGLLGSLRCLAQLKGYHLESVRGRQQYAGRHLWGGNLWNRATSLYFRNAAAADHPDFGPAYAAWQANAEEEFARVGGRPDMDGAFAGRKVPPETLAELRNCIRAGGALFLWDRIEQHAAADAARLGLDLDEYYDKVRTEG
jgi:quinone-modifying oxidoreductase subunit QmoC